MLVIPAIDLQNGEAVRLYKGDYNQKTVYSNNPVELAKTFEDMNAKLLHIVDLDGAKEGNTANLKTIKEIKDNTNLAIEIGGGIRDLDTIKLYLEDIKVDRVIIGTAALTNPQLVKEALNIYGSDKIVVGIDARNGFVSTSGWLEDSDTNYLDFIKELEAIGLKNIVVTDISKDGTLTGPNFEMYQNIKKHSNMQVVVSGGVKDSNDVIEASKQDYYGCIVGKAYYEGKIDLKEVISCLQKG